MSRKKVSEVRAYGHGVNKYCELAALKNESDVEQFFLLPLLQDLGYDSNYLNTKSKVPQLNIGKGKKKKNYYPDYLVYTNKKKDKPVLVIDAKSPDQPAEEGVQDAQLYAAVIRRGLATPKPEQYCIGTNGNFVVVKYYDSDDIFMQMSFNEFQDTNRKFKLLKSKIGRDVLSSAAFPISEVWTPSKPTVEEIKNVFQKCHKRIWKRESLLPTAAFYEFTKLIFLKLREDERLHGLIEKNKPITKKELRFHTNWIDTNSEVSPNPVNSILFHTLVEKLEDQVRKNKKKPIFTPNEEIRLKPSTIRSVVELLQDYDLSGIDEDLNGRMFEVFLSASVRGKNLGAFFTPRGIVELMVGMTNPSVSRIGGQVNIDTVLDGCCGSGGFLIDVMATMLAQIRSNPAFSAKAAELQEKVLTQSIYGIDSNPDISRIARINMYLHGDGGSGIYQADTLDKDLEVEEGEARNLVDEINELRNMLLQGKRFDLILTNPPFSSSYSSKDEHEKRIISQYKTMGLTAKPKESAKSNVLFLARYHELLEPNGRIAIILDNSMLNSYTFREYRKWLMENYIIRAIISLPKYAFIQAGAGCVTSILYMDKRESKTQEQKEVFARTVNFTGISKSGKEIKENDLPDVLKEWQQFEKTGKLYLRGTKLIGNNDSDELFLVSPKELTDRIDVSFLTPSYKKLIAGINKMGKRGTHEIKRISDFKLANQISASDAGDEIFQYIDIGALDLKRGQLLMNEVQEGTIEELPARARILIKENDVVFPLSYDSLGKAAIIPKELDGQLASTGFVVIRNKNYDDAVLLWAIIRSDIIQKQFHHIASGYTQRGISKEHLPELRFPIPINKIGITESIKKFLDGANNSRSAEIAALKSLTSMIETTLSPTKQKVLDE